MTDEPSPTLPSEPPPTIGYEAAEAPASPVLRSFGDYDLLEELARGAMPSSKSGDLGL